MPTPDLLLHPVRLRIVQLLLDQPLTTLALVEALGDVPQATVYRHVTALADGGLLRVAEERPVQGGVERTYEVVEDAAALGPADLEGADAATHLEWFTTFVGTMLAGFARAVELGGLGGGGEGAAGGGGEGGGAAGGGEAGGGAAGGGEAGGGEAGGGEAGGGEAGGGEEGGGEDGGGVAGGGEEGGGAAGGGEAGGGEAGGGEAGGGEAGGGEAGGGEAGGGEAGGGEAGGDAAGGDARDVARDLADAGVGYHVVGVWLDDDELADLLAGIRDLIQQARQHGPGGERRRRLLHTVTLPG